MDGRASTVLDRRQRGKSYVDSPRGRTQKVLCIRGDLDRCNGNFPQPSKLFALIVIGMMLSLTAVGAGNSISPCGTDAVAESPLPAGILATTLVNFTVTPTKAYIGQEVHFFANASSDVSSSLTFSIYYDSRLGDFSNNTASPHDSFTTGNPGMMTASFTYNDYGNLSDATSTYYIVTLYVGDGTNTYKTTKTVRIIDNTAPTFTAGPGSRITSAVRDVPFNISVKLVDTDDDPLHVTWDFGDGSDVATNDTAPAKLGVYANQTHTWSFELDPGVGDLEVYFTLNITADDGQGHQTRLLSNVTFYVGPNFQPENITLAVRSLTVDPQETVSFSASAVDLEGDALTWTYVFNDTVSDYHTEVIQTDRSEPNAVVYANTTHVFGSEGTYYVKLYVVDAIDPDLVLLRNQSTKLTMTVAQNNVPYVSKNITVISPVGDILLGTGEDSIEVSFSVTVADVDGDIITVTWDFGDGSEVETNSSDGELSVRFYAFHNYTASGIFNVTASVTDGRISQEIVRYKLVTVRSENLAPFFKSMSLNMSHGTFAEPGTEIGFTLVLGDPEGDPLTVTWNFGDNSSLMVVTVSEYDANGNLTVTVYHTYTVVAEYSVSITYSDNIIGTGTHNKTLDTSVRIKWEIVQEVRVWNWWDYTSLGLVLGGVGAIVIWTIVVGRFRKSLDMHGTTLDEFRIRRKEMRESYRARIASASSNDERSRLIKEMKEKTREMNQMLRHPPVVTEGGAVVGDDAEVN